MFSDVVGYFSAWDTGQRLPRRTEGQLPRAPESVTWKGTGHMEGKKGVLLSPGSACGVQPGGGLLLEFLCG